MPASAPEASFAVPTGHSWIFAGYGLLPNTCVTSLAVGPGDANVVYASTDEVSPIGIWRSADGGRSWERRARGIDSCCTVRALLLDPRRPETLYVALEYDVWRSDDDGESWVMRSTGLAAYVRGLILDPATPRAIYAVSETGLFFTSDRADSWQQISQKQGLDFLVADPRRPGSLYSLDFEGRVFHSQDGGAGWQRVGNSGLGEGGSAGFFLAEGWLYVISYGGGIVRSRDGGHHWTVATAGLTQSAVLALVPGQASLLIGTPDGVYRSEDRGRFWTKSSSGLDAAPSQRVALDAGDARLIYAGGGPYASHDGGATWQLVDTPIGSGAPAIATDPHRAGVAFVGGWGMTRTKDGGSSWASWNAVASSNCAVIRDIVISPVGDAVYASGLEVNGQCLQEPGTCLNLVSRDGGRTFDCDVTPEAGWPLQVLAVGPSEAAYAAAQTEAGFAFYRRRPEDRQWQLLTRQIYPSAIALDPTNEARIYAGDLFSGSFARSSDGGRTWEFTSLQGGAAAIASIIVDPAKPDRIYAATGDGVFISADRGSTWSTLGTPLFDVIPTQLVLDPRESSLYLATQESGILRLRPLH